MCCQARELFGPICWRGRQLNASGGRPADDNDGATQSSTLAGGCQRRAAPVAARLGQVALRLSAACWPHLHAPAEYEEQSSRSPARLHLRPRPIRAPSVLLAGPNEATLGGRGSRGDAQKARRRVWPRGDVSRADCCSGGGFGFAFAFDSDSHCACSDSCGRETRRMQIEPPKGPRARRLATSALGPISANWILKIQTNAD